MEEFDDIESNSRQAKQLKESKNPPPNNLSA
jgi:hypothetical protein